MNGQTIRRWPRARAAIRTGAACAAFVFVAGCVSGGVYPDAWAEKAEAGSTGCPVVDGEFVNEGEFFEKVDDDGLIRHTTTLGEFGCLKCQPDKESARVTVAAVTDSYEKFRLRLVDETLHIQAIAADGSTLDVEQPVRKRCRDSMMLVEADWWSSLEDEEGQEMFGATLGMSMVARRNWKLGRAADGSLLVRAGESGSLLVFYWPILPMSFSEWVRFPPAATTPAAEAATPALVLQLSAPVRASDFGSGDQHATDQAP
jgi:hypothetical protein